MSLDLILWPPAPKKNECQPWQSEMLQEGTVEVYARRATCEGARARTCTDACQVSVRRNARRLLRFVSFLRPRPRAVLAGARRGAGAGLVRSVLDTTRPTTCVSPRMVVSFSTSDAWCVAHCVRSSGLIARFSNGEYEESESRGALSNRISKGDYDGAGPCPCLRPRSVFHSVWFSWFLKCQ